MLKYPNLFSSITIAGTVFKNRIFASPIGAHPLSTDKLPMAETRAFYRRKALGGAASVCIGDCIVDSKLGKFNVNHTALDHPAASSALSLLADSITAHGAIASVELQHAGMYARQSAAAGSQIYGPVEYIDNSGNRVLPMTDEIIDEAVTAFANAALTAKRAGFGMVTIHGGHGWLISQFMSPFINNRTDKWGGSVENRARFPIAVADAIKKAVGPAFPVEIRISGSECFDGGYDIDEGIAFAKQLDGHVDLIHVSAGNHEVSEVFTVTHPSMFLDDGVNVRFAAEIKKHVATPVACVGSLTDPAMMEEIIASGKADIVELARGLLADPDLPNKARAGRDSEIRECIRCLACFSGLMTRQRYSCALNPEIGNEFYHFHHSVTTKPTSVPKTALIAGGGIAGMEAALNASKHGHHVILCEKEAYLGGVLLCEEQVPFKRHLSNYIRKRILELRDAHIDIRLNTEVTPLLAENIKPDILIAALGAEEVVPNISGITNSYVLSAVEAYKSPASVGTNAVIIGGGLVGTELAVYLAGLGRKITIIEACPALSNGGNILQALALSLEIKKLGINVILNTQVNEISNNTLTCNDSTQLNADTVIYAVGQRPRRELAERLRMLAPEFHQIGDCLSPRSIQSAVTEAYYMNL